MKITPKHIRNSQIRGVLLFMGITMLFHVLWRLGRGWLESWDVYIIMSDVAVQHVYSVSARINEFLLGDAVQRIDPSYMFRITGRVNGDLFTGYMVVDDTCSGLKQFYQAIVLFMLYPGPWRHKLWYIPTALLAMHMVNIFRIVALSFTMVHHYQHWDMMHDWVLRPLFYVVLFGLWVFWEERFNSRQNLQQAAINL
jgi:exosortase/archaeosortase family protein